MQEARSSTPREATKLITCILPDDGSHRALLEALHREKQLNKAQAVSCLATGTLADARVKPGTLPDVYLARMVWVVVPEAEADALFEFIYHKARIGRDGGGVMLQNALVAATPFALPEDVAEEEA
ncbi:MAG: hypothetical protein QNJ87_00965 [Gammaproteobacteria bacterium]|nr:hypothetical protein [Gammaproteobacteria bacterium]MDJ0870320.1 hypothetical protein [Gammaproteobacteria bacterium]MDJ0892436.1 hypothetical protein [Gammaproteobacteria bacterium]